MSMRDYGLPDPTPVEGAVPQWKPADVPCPSCGGLLCEVTVEVTFPNELAVMPQLRGGRGICVYLGCPACPYASPSVNRALTP